MSYLKELREIVGHRPLLSAGATIVIIKDGKILLQLRSDTHTWGIPGGAIELGETLYETARRELYEETGLTAKSFRLLTTLAGKDFYFVYPNGDMLYSVVSLFLAEGVEGEPHVNDNESLNFGYFSPDELPEMESRAVAVLKWLSDNGII